MIQQEALSEYTHAAGAVTRYHSSLKLCVKVLQEFLFQKKIAIPQEA